jgi:Uma2 family endonuclease
MRSAMAALPDLITVAQFRQMAEDGEFVYELHHGEVVALTRPKARHWMIQRLLVRLLEMRLAGFGEAGMEFPYRPYPEFELRVADVAVVSNQRWAAIDPDDNLRGAPDLVIEVKSPWNTKSQLQELAALCLANGAIEFWVVDPERKTVSVVRSEGTAIVYALGSAIPLTAFGGDGLPVDEIFA